MKLVNRALFSCSTCVNYVAFKFVAIFLVV